MANNKGLFPEIINDYHVYLGNGDDVNEPLLGIGNSMTLPDLDEMTETLTGAGILGEIEANNPGHFSNIELTIPFTGVCEGMFDLNSKERTYLTIRASLQSTEKATGELKYSGIKIVVGGKVKGYTLGNFEQGRRSESGVKMAVTYLKIEMKYKDPEEDVTSFELDKFNEVYTVNNVDMLEDIKEFS